MKLFQLNSDMENIANLTDDGILKLFNETGDKTAYLEVYRRYHVQLYSAARKRGLSAEVAEEVVQDLFINLWNQRMNIHIHSSLSGYLFTAIRNLVLNQMQKESVRLRFQDSLKIHIHDFDNSTEENVIAKDLDANLHKNVLALPEKCRFVFELSRKHHKSNKQIAFELGISEKTVENHMTKAIRYLRLSLSHLLFHFLLVVYQMFL